MVGEVPRVAGHAEQRLAGGVAAGDGWHGLDGLWLDYSRPTLLHIQVALSSVSHHTKSRNEIIQYQNI